MITAEEAGKISDLNSSEEVKVKKIVDKEMTLVEESIKRSAYIGYKSTFVKKNLHPETQKLLKSFGYALSVCTPCFETKISWE